MPEDEVSASEVCEALVREYLKRHGCSDAASAFEREKPRGPNAISSRNVLLKYLQLSTAAKERKEAGKPFGSILELLAETNAKGKSGLAPTGAPTRGTQRRPSAAKAEVNPPAAHEDPWANLRGGAGQIQSVNATDAGNSSSDEDGVVTEMLDAAFPKSSSQPLPAPAKGWANNERAGSQSTARNSAQPSAESFVVHRAGEPDADTRGPEPAGSMPLRIASLEPLPASQLVKLRQTLFGQQAFVHPEWKQAWHQGFFKCDDVNDVNFGLHQEKGGPCGVLAAVNAEMVQSACIERGKSLNWDSMTFRSALLEALSRSIWRCAKRSSSSGGTRAFVALPCAKSATVPATFPRDGILEHIGCIEATSKDDVLKALENHFDIYTSRYSWGVCLLLCSCVLSRGIDHVLSALSGNCLVDKYATCSMDMMNLLSCGEPSPYVHDGNLDVGGMTLCGVQAKPVWGMLSLFEYYKSIEVGNSYKRPDHPIWVINAEGHFTMLVCLGGISEEAPFDAVWWDGLNRQDTQCKVRISPGIGTDEEINDSLAPPLLLVLQTRWEKAKVDWLTTDPVL